MYYFLKAESETELQAALVAAQVICSEGDACRVSDGLALDIIGTIIKPTGNLIAVDGLEVPETAPIPGYHANLAGELSPDQLAALAHVLFDEPEQPYRVWAQG